MRTRSRSFASTPEASTEASTFVLALADEWALPESLVEKALMMVGEAVPNAAEHANRLDPSFEVQLTVTLSEEEFQLCVEDQGPGITMEQLEAAELPDDPFQDHGRGLYIIRSLAGRYWLEASGRRLCVAWPVDAAE